jgi:hypothetical protein
MRKQQAEFEPTFLSYVEHLKTEAKVFPRVETKTPVFIFEKSENKRKFAHFFVFAEVFAKNVCSRDGFRENFR